MDSFTFWLKETMNKILQKAIDSARNIPYVKGQARVWSIVTDRKGKVVSSSGNSYTCTHPAMARTSKKLGLCKEYLHSEVSALLKAKGKGCKLHVARVDSKGNPVSAFPCIVCQSFIKIDGSIKEIEHTV